MRTFLIIVVVYIIGQGSADRNTARDCKTQGYARLAGGTTIICTVKP